MSKAVATLEAKVKYLERMLHETLHHTPKSTEDCQNFCFMTFTRYEDGTYGHSCGGCLDPVEALMAVYGKSAIKKEVTRVIQDALTLSKKRKA